jgi:hypothetical protein
VGEVAAGLELRSQLSLEPALHLEKPAEGGDEGVVARWDREHDENLTRQ